jgi:3-oxoadipate enol-lactonase
MNNMYPAERGFVALPDGRRLAFEARGAPRAEPPILLVRPLGGSIDPWGDFGDVLAARARVIAFDRGGTGESSDAPFRATTRAMAEDAVAVLDHAGVEQAHVFGISLGGMVATWLAIEAPARVARLCLASTPPSGLDLSWQGVGRAASLAACLLRAPGSVQSCLVRRVLSKDVRRRQPRRAAELAQPMTGRPPRRVELLKQAAAAALHEANDRLYSITAPTLVLAGERDELIGLEPQRELARAIPGARFRIVEEAGHDLTLEAPLATAETVLRFFFEGS